jgi:S-DNA-T family DNA segregation ATPase FtsK/SpoIIIE
MTEKTFSTHVRELCGILSLAFTLYGILALVTYSPKDPSFVNYASGPVQNAGGLVGAYLSDGLVQLFGSGGFFFPLITLILGWALIRGRRFHNGSMVLASGVLFLVSLCSLMAIKFSGDPFFGKAIPAGGLTGNGLGGFLTHWLNTVGATLTLVTCLFISLLTMTRISANALLDGMGSAVVAGVRLSGRGALQMKSGVREGIEKYRAARAERIDQMEQRELLLPSAPLIVTPDRPREIEILEPPRRKEEPSEFVIEEDVPKPARAGKYKVPPISLLEEPPPMEDSKQIRDEILESSGILEQKLADFGIQGRVVQVLPGPVITLYEFEPAPGVKVSRIISLADDLSLAMRATSLRILAPVPGKSVVGIEIPNSKKETVSFKEIISSREFRDSPSKLSLAIGKDNIGQPVVQDLATIPHLLMAGSTGSGKSVGLNAMNCSILLNATPDEVKMIMVDPKMLELSIYDGIPHLIAPVVTNPKKAAAALQWAVSEMENRYKLMAEAGVRNIIGYNQFVEKLENEFEYEAEMDAEDEEEETPARPTKLPYIVVLIDELADLMMVASKGVEESLTRLAQMARAAGIHLIVATQRPSVDVLTGIIKANFPARISYKVTSRVDSRTILDSMGADKLLGKGDMLFLPPGTSRLLRIHGPWVSDLEIKRIVDFIKSQKKPEYQEDIFQAAAQESPAGEDEEFDEKYDEAVALVAKDRQASISYVQRRLRIGYNRAARIIETMEKEGVVGPSDGIRPREIYVKPILFE